MSDFTLKVTGLPERERRRSVARLRALRKKLIDQWEVPDELIALDSTRLRLLTTTSVAHEAAKLLNRTVALVKEYPTRDCLIVQAQILHKRS